jgi:cation diffusion facilitator CzcD-associated flavoprotein CzcO
MNQKAMDITETKILIVGTGGNAISVGRELLMNGEEDFLFISRSEQFGGAWLDAKFPGAQVDSPSSLYQFSYAMNPNWSKPFPDADEFLRYLVDTADRFDLPAHAHFGVTMSDASWSEEDRVWRVETDKGLYQSKFLIIVTGYLDEPHPMDLPGKDDFPGRIVLAARWPEDYDPEGQDVVVVGSGSTAVEVIPELVKSARHLTSLQRTPSWVLPKPNEPYSPQLKAEWAAEPRLLALQRNREFTNFEISDRVADGPRIEAECLDFLRSQVLDPALRAGLTPTHAFACKRPLFSSTYLRSLNSANVDVVFEGMKAFTPYGILTDSDREIRADSVVLTTGYHWGDHILHRIRRADGVTVAEHQKGWVRAYKSIMVAGCPNLFLVGGAGPNSQHASGMYHGEMAAKSVVFLLNEIAVQKQDAIEVRETAEVAWKKWADSVLDNDPTVRGGCRNNNQDGFGHNKALWPGTPFDLAYQLTHIELDDFILS